MTDKLFEKCSKHYRELELKYGQDQMIDLWKEFDLYLQEQGTSMVEYQFQLKSRLTDSFLRKMGKPVVEKKIPIHR